MTMTSLHFSKLLRRTSPCPGLTRVCRGWWCWVLRRPILSREIVLVPTAAVLAATSGLRSCSRLGYNSAAFLLERERTNKTSQFYAVEMARLLTGECRPGKLRGKTEDPCRLPSASLLHCLSPWLSELHTHLPRNVRFTVKNLRKLWKLYRYILT